MRSTAWLRATRSSSTPPATIRNSSKRSWRPKNPAAAVPDDELAALTGIRSLAAILMEGMQEWTRQGWAGVLGDDLALAGGWGFRLDEISAPVELWHGDLDMLVPFHHAQYLTAHLSAATLHRCVGEGHLAMFAHQSEVLTYLTRGVT